MIGTSMVSPTAAIVSGTASVDALFAEARRLGATVVQVNHPLIPYGYFTSLAAGVAPGQGPIVEDGGGNFLRVFGLATTKEP